MTNLFIGFIFGVVVSAIGFDGVVKILDGGVEKVQDVSRELSKE